MSARDLKAALVQLRAAAVAVERSEFPIAERLELLKVAADVANQALIDHARDPDPLRVTVAAQFMAAKMNHAPALAAESRVNRAAAALSWADELIAEACK